MQKVCTKYDLAKVPSEIKKLIQPMSYLDNVLEHFLNFHETFASINI